jgi:Zn-dependent peptidase ImmA (M78 family)
MEYQANYFAASLLMPRAHFVADFWRELRRIDLRDKGFGALFVDDQQCNLDNYRSVTDALTARYQVSRQAVTIRLGALGLLRDRRTVGDHLSVQSHLVSAFTRLVAPDAE